VRAELEGRKRVSGGRTFLLSSLMTISSNTNSARPQAPTRVATSTGEPGERRRRRMWVPIGLGHEGSKKIKLHN
jgi:hypothetical protein